MYNLNKKEKLEFIKQQIEKRGISAYTISKNTNLTEAGVGKILNGSVKNPHESSIDTIFLYIEKINTGSDISSESNKTEEPNSAYNKSAIDSEGFKNCLQEVNTLTREIIILQGLLRKNNIEFKNIFENEN